MNDIPVKKIKEFEEEFLSFMRTSHADVLADLKSGKIKDSAASTIENVAADLSAKYKIEA